MFMIRCPRELFLSLSGTLPGWNFLFIVGSGSSVFSKRVLVYLVDFPWFDCLKVNLRCLTCFRYLYHSLSARISFVEHLLLGLSVVYATYNSVSESNFMWWHARVCVWGICFGFTLSSTIQLSTLSSFPWSLLENKKWATASLLLPTQKSSRWWYLPKFWSLWLQGYLLFWTCLVPSC